MKEKQEEERAKDRRTTEQTRHNDIGTMKKIENLGAVRGGAGEPQTDPTHPIPSTLWGTNTRLQKSNEETDSEKLFKGQEERRTQKQTTRDGPRDHEARGPRVARTKSGKQTLV